MATTIATAIPQGLALTSDFMAEHDLKPGTRVNLTLGASQVPLERVDDNLVDDLCGLFAGGPSMTDELLKRAQRGTRKGTILIYILIQAQSCAT